MYPPCGLIWIRGMHNAAISAKTPAHHIPMATPSGTKMDPIHSPIATKLATTITSEPRRARGMYLSVRAHQ